MMACNTEAPSELACTAAASSQDLSSVLEVRQAVAGVGSAAFIWAG